MSYLIYLSKWDPGGGVGVLPNIFIVPLIWKLFLYHCDLWISYACIILICNVIYMHRFDLWTLQLYLCITLICECYMNVSFDLWVSYHLCVFILRSLMFYLAINTVSLSLSLSYRVDSWHMSPCHSRGDTWESHAKDGNSHTWERRPWCWMGAMSTMSWVSFEGSDICLQKIIYIYRRNWLTELQ